VDRAWPLVPGQVPYDPGPLPYRARGQSISRDHMRIPRLGANRERASAWACGHMDDPYDREKGACAQASGAPKNGFC
jgi:hypothetical protein